MQLLTICPPLGAQMQKLTTWLVRSNRSAAPSGMEIREMHCNDASRLRIEAQVASVRDDQRADYLWSTKRGAAAVGCHPNKFGAWARRSRQKLLALCVEMPGETAAEFLSIIAEAEALRQRRTSEAIRESARRT